MKWFLKNMFWILGIGIVGLAVVAIQKEDSLACLALLVLFVFTLVTGMYYANVEFTKDVLTEYDRLSKVQAKKPLKVIKGGK